MNGKFDKYLDRSSKIVSILGVAIPTLFYIYHQYFSGTPNSLSSNKLSIVIMMFFIAIISLNNLFLRRKNKLEHLNATKKSVFKFQSLCTALRKSICDIHNSEEKLTDRLFEAIGEEEVSLIEKQFESDYQRLFCSPTIELTSEIRKMMKKYVNDKFGREENFRVVVKLLYKETSQQPHQLKYNFREEDNDIRDWRFNNTIWDNYTWENTIKHMNPDEVRYSYKISENSAIEGLALRKNMFFSSNNIQKEQGDLYHSHNSKWKDTYNAKFLSRIENRSTEMLYGFISIDTLNTHNIEIFNSNGDLSFPKNIGIFAAESLSVLISALEIYHKNISRRITERRGVIRKDRRRDDAPVA